MSALQASRKYGVPSRTLYDKVPTVVVVVVYHVARVASGHGLLKKF